jgi:Uma2 family endonuclease
MVAVAENLTLSEFQAKYEKGDRSYEFWRGRAMPKGMPTWIHGLLQLIIGELLKETGYIAGSEVELRIESDARPRPDVIATRGAVEIPYPTSAVDVVVEILSPDDSMAYMIEKCRAYHAWGFPGIYVVDPDSRSVFRWTEEALELSNVLASIPAEKIWEELTQRLVPPTP